MIGNYLIIFLIYGLKMNLIKTLNFNNIQTIGFGNQDSITTSPKFAYLLSITRQDIEDPLFTIEVAVVKNIQATTPYTRTFYPDKLLKNGKTTNF